MQELVFTRFDTGAFPSHWLVERNNHVFENGGMRNGIRSLKRVPKYLAKFYVARRSDDTLIRIPIPRNGWNSLRIELEMEFSRECSVTCTCDKMKIAIEKNDHVLPRNKVSRNGWRLSLAENSTRIIPGTGARNVTFEFRPHRVSGFVDEQHIIEADVTSNPIPYTGYVEIAFHRDCLIRSLRILGDGELHKPLYNTLAKKFDDFFLEVAVDFWDDLKLADCPYTEESFDRLFSELKSWGTRRCHWIYCGGSKNGWWDSAGVSVENKVPGYFAKTVENVGEVISAAVQAAHAHGIELYAVIKPFDIGGFIHTVGEGTPEATELGKAKTIGGVRHWIADFPAHHPEFLMARKPGIYGDGTEGRSFTRIDLVKEDEAPCDIKPHDIKLFVSDDNATYKAYSAPFKVEEMIEDYPVWEHSPSGGRLTGQTRRSRIFRLTNLNITQKYFAIYTHKQKRSFYNTLINLVHVFGEKGEERRLTCGIIPRSSAGFSSSSVKNPNVEHDFQKYGVEFDAIPGVPTAVFAGFNALDAPYALDANKGFIAIARGKDRSPAAALSPAFPETRAYWISWVKDCLDADVDGIEMRVRNHHSPFSWDEFGFEEPVKDEFKERFGVDIWETDDFDCGNLRRLRGEMYTQFYREVKELTSQHGKSLGLHISSTMDMEPDEGAAMNIHWDWRTWLEEGLADSVTLKEVWPGTRLCQEILSVTQPKGIRTVFSPMANGLWNSAGGEQVVANWIRTAREAGINGYQFYECAVVANLSSNNKVVMRQPALKKVFKEIKNEY